MKFGIAHGTDPIDITERKAKANANVREADLRYGMQMNRLRRKVTRCRCGHSKAVHVDKVCQMDCECSSYRKR